MRNLIKKILFRREKFWEGASVLTITTFGSYALGLIRDKIFANNFGANRTLDIYNAAFIIPDLLLNILVAGALSAAFIPVISGLITKGDENKISEVGSSVINGAVAAILFFGSIAFIFMPILAPRLAVGFSPTEIDTLVAQSRLLLLSPLIFAVSNGLGSILLSYKTYVAYGAAPLLYNLGIIGGATLGDIRYVIAGTLIGALLHLGIRLIAIRKAPFRYLPVFDWRNKDFRTVIRLMIPKMIGHPVEQVTFMMFTNIASTLAAGSITMVSFARNFQSVPVSLFGIAFSLAIFPMLCEAAARTDRTEWLAHFKKAGRDILIFTIPSAIFLYFFSEIPISILLGGGKFTSENVTRTAFTLSLFALAVPTESLNHLLARGFYSMKDTLIPVKVSVLGLGVTAIFAYRLTPSLDIAAIPLAFVAGSALRVILLGFLLPWKLRRAGMAR